MLTWLDFIEKEVARPKTGTGTGPLEQNKAERKKIETLQFQNPVAIFFFFFLSFVFFSTGLFFFKQRADSVRGQGEGCCEAQSL